MLHNSKYTRMSPWKCLILHSIIRNDYIYQFHALYIYLIPKDVLSGDCHDQAESKERDPMNRCQDAESKEGIQMKGVPYNSERVIVNPLLGHL